MMTMKHCQPLSKMDKFEDCTPWNPLQSPCCEQERHKTYWSPILIGGCLKKVKLHLLLAATTQWHKLPTQLVWTKRHFKLVQVDKANGTGSLWKGLKHWLIQNKIKWKAPFSFFGLEWMPFSLLTTTCVMIFLQHCALDRLWIFHWFTQLFWVWSQVCSPWSTFCFLWQWLNARKSLRNQRLFCNSLSIVMHVLSFWCRQWKQQKTMHTVLSSVVKLWLCVWIVQATLDSFGCAFSWNECGFVFSHNVCIFQSVF